MTAFRINTFNSRNYPTAHTMLLAAHNFNLNSPVEIVIVGQADAQDTRDMLNAAADIFIPNKVILFKSTDDNKLSELAPFTQYYASIDNKANAYVSRNFSCKLPTTNIDSMIDMIVID